MLVFCWLVRVLSSKEYVSCVCNLGVCLGVPSICRICMSDGGRMSEKVASVSVVNCVQFAFL